MDKYKWVKELEEVLDKYSSTLRTLKHGDTRATRWKEREMSNEPEETNT